MKYYLEKFKIYKLMRAMLWSGLEVSFVEDIKFTQINI